MRMFVVLGVKELEMVHSLLCTVVPTNTLLDENDERLFLHPSRIIKCADEGPCYRVPRKGDTFFAADVNCIEKAHYDGEPLRNLLCFPAPERNSHQTATKTKEAL